jgi:hypothetical protein
LTSRAVAIVASVDLERRHACRSSSSTEGLMLLEFPQANKIVPARESVRPSLWLVLDLEAKKRGSLEEQLFALAARLRASGVAGTFVFASAPPSWMRVELAGVELRQLDFRRRAAAATLWRWLRTARPALVHFHFVRAHSPLVLAARLCGAHVVVHDHMALGVAFVDVPARSSAVAAAARGWKRARAALCRRWVDRRVAVSRFVAGSSCPATTWRWSSTASTWRASPARRAQRCGTNWVPARGR